MLSLLSNRRFTIGGKRITLFVWNTQWSSLATALKSISMPERPSLSRTGLRMESFKWTSRQPFTSMTIISVIWERGEGDVD
jgi:hypothetical protein